MQNSTFKNALWLTGFQIRHSLFSYFILAIIIVFLYVFIAPALSSTDESVGMGTDFHFFMPFILCSILRFQPFRVVPIGSMEYATPFHVFVRKLPVRRTTYIAHNIMYQFMISFLVVTIYLTLLYVNSDLTLSYTSYISFIFIWIGITYTLNLLDVYSHFGYNFIVWLAIIICTLPVLFLINLFVFYIYIYDRGFVYWTLQMAEKFPIYTMMAALLFIILNIIFWQRLYNRKMRTYDLFI